MPTRRDWPAVLSELARQIDDGRIYNRDLTSLAEALQPVLTAYEARAAALERRAYRAR